MNAFVLPPHLRGEGIPLLHPLPLGEGNLFFHPLPLGEGRGEGMCASHLAETALTLTLSQRVRGSKFLLSQGEREQNQEIRI